MAQNIRVGQTVTGTPTEQDVGGGAVAVVAANIAWSVDNLEIVTYAVDRPTGVATFTGVGVGTAKITVRDSKYGLEYTDELVVSPKTKLGIVWGQPQGGIQ